MVSYSVRFERELEALRKELAEATASSSVSSRSGASTPTPHDVDESGGRNSAGGHHYTQSESSATSSPVGSPIVVGRDGTSLIMEGLALDEEHELKKDR